MTDKKQHCNHEKICVFALQSPISDGCPVDKGIIQKCKHDTRSRPATAPDPEQCPDTCVYKRFAANMRNSEEHDAKVTARAREEELVELLDISKGVWNLPDMQDRIRARIKSLRTGGGK